MDGKPIKFSLLSVVLLSVAISSVAHAQSFSLYGATALNYPVGYNTSENWAGYVAATGQYTSVGASWIVPQATVNTNNAVSADATWVGVGGISSTDLIQAGTQTIFQDGVPTYEAWYEALPSSMVQVPLVIHPGDSVTVSVVEQSGNEWELSFADTTTGQSYQTLTSYDSSLSSAEWIEEMPSDGQGLVPLDTFGSVSFSNGFAVQNGSQVDIDGSAARPIIMVADDGQALASPTVLGSDGASFAVDQGTAAVVSQPRVVRSVRPVRTGVGIRGFTSPSRTVRRARRPSFGSFRGAFNAFGEHGRAEF